MIASTYLRQGISPYVDGKVNVEHDKMIRTGISIDRKQTTRDAEPVNEQPLAMELPGAESQDLKKLSQANRHIHLSA